MTTPSFVLSLTLITLFIHSALSCFVTNCPPGGKRSAFSYPSPSFRRQCMACGPGGKGRCFSPSICCGDFGCLMSAAETSECAKENYIHSPCKNEGVVCGNNGKGICGTDGFCCDESGCLNDVKCSLPMLNSASFS